MRNRGLLIVLSGPSGSGKGTVRNVVMQKDANLRFSVSATTRAPRTGEEDGREYYFMDRESFLRGMEEGKFLESTCYCGNYYGTLKSEVDRLRQQGYDVILEIETQGAEMVMNREPDCVSIFLLPPSIEELKRRLVGRGTEQECEITKRLEAAQRELKQKENYRYCVVNENVERTAQEVLSIIQAERETNKKEF